MKTLLKISLFALFILMNACSPTYHYQVFNNKSLDDKNIISFENEQIRLEYDLWAEDGQLEIHVLNKTEGPLFLDLSQSALIINGVAVPVYQDIELISETSTLKGRSASYINWYGSPSYFKVASFSRALKIAPIVYLPNKATTISLLLPGQLTTKYISPEAKLKRGESKKSLAFSKEKTPYSFRFNLGYSSNKDMKDMTHIDDEFWVESILVMRGKEFFGDVIGRNSKTGYYDYKFPYMKKNAFYVKYQVGGQ